MVSIQLPDGSRREFPGPVTVAEVAASIGTGLAKAARGGFNNTPSMTMLGHAIQHAVQRSGVDPAEVEDVVANVTIADARRVKSLEDAEQKLRATEANLARQLEHPNIIRIVEVGRAVAGQGALHHRYVSCCRRAVRCRSFGVTARRAFGLARSVPMRSDEAESAAFCPAMRRPSARLPPCDVGRTRPRGDHQSSKWLTFLPDEVIISSLGETIRRSIASA